jgi:hypothetical protein
LNREMRREKEKGANDMIMLFTGEENGMKYSLDSR